MKQTRVRPIVTCLGALVTTMIVGAMVACGGGEHPGAAADISLVQDSGVREAGGSGVTFDIDLAKGISFGDDGLVSCGTQANDRSITLKNTTSEIVNYKVEVIAGSDYYKVTPTDGGIQAGQSVSLKITPNPIPKVSEVTTDLYAGTIAVSFPGEPSRDDDGDAAVSGMGHRGG